MMCLFGGALWKGHQVLQEDCSAPFALLEAVRTLERAAFGRANGHGFLTSTLEQLLQSQDPQIVGLLAGLRTQGLQLESQVEDLLKKGTSHIEAFWTVIDTNLKTVENCLEQLSQYIDPKSLSEQLIQTFIVPYLESCFRSEGVRLELERIFLESSLTVPPPPDEEPVTLVSNPFFLHIRVTPVVVPDEQTSTSPIVRIEGIYGEEKRLHAIRLLKERYPNVEVVPTDFFPREFSENIMVIFPPNTDIIPELTAEIEQLLSTVD